MSADDNAIAQGPAAPRPVASAGACGAAGCGPRREFEVALRNGRDISVPATNVRTSYRRWVFVSSQQLSAQSVSLELSPGVSDPV